MPFLMKEVAVSYEGLKDFLEKLGQNHLLEGASTLSDKQIASFMDELKCYGPGLLQSQRKALDLQKISESCKELVSPAPASEEKEVLDLAFEGKVACVILAGGMGSRLGSTIPKALIPVAPVTGKTLLQLHMQRAKALCHIARRPLFVAVVVSIHNKEVIERFIVEHDFFGLSKDFVSVVCQEELPFLTVDGSWALKEPGKLLVGPDGNGKALALLAKEGILAKWQGAGVGYVNVIQIDNPLADPFDLKMIDAMRRQGADAAVRAVTLASANEPLGLIIQEGSKVKVMEYSEVSKEQRDNLACSGRWRHLLANTGIMAFSLPFLLKVQGMPLPWHIAYKRAGLWRKDKGISEEFLWKFEYFLFDVFDYADSVAVVVSPRDECYAPLKAAEGPMGVEAVSAALLSSYRHLYERVSGCKAPQRPFELAPAFFYPDEDLYSRWRGRLLPDGDYIDA
jgi:UDP-N-acetylglucosamine/UDP-N-acetylgalactosamine diphosphorylase